MTAVAARLAVLPGGRTESPPAADEATHWLAPTDAASISEPAGAPALDPEHQLVGALMWLPAATVCRIAAVVPTDAITRPTTRWAYEVITGVAAAGHNPDPVLVLATAKRQPCSIAGEDTGVPTAARHHQLSLYLARAYTETVCPDNAAAYAREVLDNAYRRAFASAGARMQALAEADVDRTELTEQFSEVLDELRSWWRRAETADQPRWADQ